MKTKHTPGPWKADTYENLTCESLYVTSEKGIIIGVGQYDISSTGAETVTKEEGQANGLLIAAAPDMLACCLSLIEWEKRGVTEELNVRTILIAAKAAIRKATQT